MRAPPLVVARWKVFAEMAAATLFAPQRGFGHQLRQRHEILRALVDVFSGHYGELFLCASQIFGAADEAYIAPHNLLHAFFDSLVQPPFGEIESDRGRFRLVL